MITLITRADDAGASLSANAAMEKITAGGYIKNISVLAAGAFVDDAAQRLKRHKHICFGLHTAINSEWDRMRWGPVRSGSPALVDSAGFFHQDPAYFKQNPPPIEDILREYDAQLDRLTRAGFHISYADSHMLPEKVIPGLWEAMSAWTHKKGLVDHSLFRVRLPRMNDVAHQPGLLREVFARLPEGQYVLILHPAKDSPEMRGLGNAQVPGAQLAKDRDEDMRFAADPDTLKTCAAFHVTPIRYDEAVPDKGPAAPFI